MLALVSTSDVTAILDRIDALGLKPGLSKRGWNHMGAVLSDAALQAGVSYRNTVRPRVEDLVTHWPDATTTSAFRELIASEDVAAVLRWKADGKKIVTLRALVDYLNEAEIETVSSLREALQREDFREDLRRSVKGVGPKTIDYLAILSGSEDDVAVDGQIRRFVRDAGVQARSYDQIRRLICEAAAVRGWSAGSLDAAIWTYQSSPD